MDHHHFLTFELKLIVLEWVSKYKLLRDFCCNLEKWLFFLFLTGFKRLYLYNMKSKLIENQGRKREIGPLSVSLRLD